LRGGFFLPLPLVSERGVICLELATQIVDAIDWQLAPSLQTQGSKKSII